MPRRRRPGRKAGKPSRPRHHPPLPRGGKRPGAGRPPSVLANAAPLVSISSRIPAELRERLIAAADAADATVSAVILAALQRYLLPVNSTARLSGSQPEGQPIPSPATNMGVVKEGGDSTGEIDDAIDMTGAYDVLVNPAGDTLHKNEAELPNNWAGNQAGEKESEQAGEPPADPPSWDSVEGERPLVL